MNERVTRFIDKLFEGRQMDKDARDLRDELLVNCNERYEDYLAEGLTEDEAMARMRDNLGDLDELLHKCARAQADVEGHSGIEARYAVRGINTVRIEARTLGIALEPIEGNELMIAFEGPEEDFEDVHYALRGDVLEIKQKATDLFDVFNKLFRWPRSSKVRLGVPAHAQLDYRIECVSGGIAMGVAIRDAKIETVSGGVRIESPAGHAARRLSVECKSGGVSVSGRYDSIKIESVSGTVTCEGSAETLRIESASGTQRVEGRYESIQMEVVSGPMHLSGEFGTARLESVSGSIHMRCRRAPESVNAQMVSGSLNIELPSDIAGFSVSHSAVSGRLHNAFGANPYGTGDTRISSQALSGSVRVTKGPPSDHM